MRTENITSKCSPRTPILCVLRMICGFAATVSAEAFSCTWYTYCPNAISWPAGAHTFSSFRWKETVTVYSPAASAFSKGSLYSFSLNGSTAVSSASVRITFPFFASVTLQSKVSVFTKRFLLITFTVSAVTSAVIF